MCVLMYTVRMCGVKPKDIHWWLASYPIQALYAHDMISSVAQSCELITHALATSGILSSIGTVTIITVKKLLYSYIYMHIQTYIHIMYMYVYMYVFILCMYIHTIYIHTYVYMYVKFCDTHFRE